MKHHSRTLLSILLFLCFSIAGNAQTKRICVIGSSTSAGYFNGEYPKDSSYVNKLKAYYKSKGLIDTIYNIAVNGTDCYTGMPSSYTPPPGRNAPDPRLNITRAVNFVPKPDVIIVNYPSNGYDYMSFSEILFCLQTIRDSALANGIECYITTSQPRDHFYEDRYRLATIADSIMNRFGEFAIDFFTDVTQKPEMIIKPEYALGDGVHLNPAGHTILEQKVIEKNILHSVLALNFLNVSVEEKGNTAQIVWKVSDQSQVKSYAIEHSPDGTHFTVAGSVNKNNTGIYQFEDPSGTDVNNYYRVRALLQNGSAIFSKIVALHPTKFSFETGKMFFRNDALIVEFFHSNAPVSISLFALNGQKLFTERINGKGNFSFEKNFDHLAAGSYEILLTDGNYKIAKLLLKK